MISWNNCLLFNFKNTVLKHILSENFSAVGPISYQERNPEYFLLAFLKFRNHVEVYPAGALVQLSGGIKFGDLNTRTTGKSAGSSRLGED